VFYLGGQSNMEGFGYVKNLPDSLNKKMKNVLSIKEILLEIMMQVED
jgi:hypothetical protein